MSKLFTINGCKVEFPYKPYPSQLAMMSKLIRSVSRSENGLLESPTGSGKTLALLCSVLAFQKQQYEKSLENVDCSCKDRLIPENICFPIKSNVKTQFDEVPQLSKPSPEEKYIEIDKKDIKIDKKDIKIEKKDIRMDMSHSEEHSIDLTQDDDDDDFKDNQYSSFSESPSRLALNIKRRRSTNSGDDAAKRINTDQSACGQSCHCDVDIEDINIDKKKSTKFTTPYKGEVMMENPNFICKCAAKNNITRIPKIYYGSRTHYQISQIVRELNKTSYKNTRMTILASRERTCIDPVVSQEQNKNEKCSNKIKYDGCGYHDAALRLISHLSLSRHRVKDAWNLKDMIEICQRKELKACPYYAIRQLKDSADIVFCPYNYLIDESIRTSMQINLKDAIVIFDEAHNVEDCSREVGDVIVTDSELKTLSENLVCLAEEDILSKEHLFLNELVKQMQTMHNKYKNESDQGANTNCRTLNPQEIRSEFKIMDISSVRLNKLKRVFTEITDDSSGQDNLGQVFINPVSKQTLGNILKILSLMLSKDATFFDDFRIVMTREIKNVPIKQNENNWLDKRNRHSKYESCIIYSMNFWLMNPGTVFSELNTFCRSIIVTSGTLSPMVSFSSELCVDFANTLQTNHIIDKSQVWVGALGYGFCGTPLLGTFKHTQSLNYQDQIGELIMSVCEKVPAGVLCFVSSYRLLNILLERWTTTGTYEKFFNRKRVMRETKGKDFDQFLLNYEEGIRETCGPNRNENHRNEINGVLLFAVCRGKISEGMDFSDDNARAVITVGIPYPSYMNQNVQLKMKYNTANIKKGLQDGQNWYSTQAFRTLNQALGRCIRHRFHVTPLVNYQDGFIRNVNFTPILTSQ